MKILNDILRAVFEDNKARIILEITPFGDICFKEDNGSGESYKILQIYVCDSVLSADNPFRFSLHVIGKNQKKYNCFMKQGGLFRKAYQPNLYREVYLRGRLLGHLDSLHHRREGQLYIADKLWYTDTKLADCRLVDTVEFYDLVMAHGIFGFKTLDDLTKIDSYNKKPLFYVQKLYWGYGRNRDTDSLFQCINLQNLSIWHEHVAYLDENIARLFNLSILHLYNLHGDIPKSCLDALHRLPYLVSLRVGADLSALPAHLDRLESLRYLNLAGNTLSDFSDIIKLSYLKTLNIMANQFETLDGIENLQALEILDVSNNNISALPEGLKDLPNLRELDLSKNPLKIIPDWVCEMTQLEVLNLEQTQLETLPDGITNLSGLKSLKLKKNPFKALPKVMRKMPKRPLDLELRNIALYDETAREKLSQYSTGEHLLDSDFNFKLMVIQQLMYVDEVLLPKFDIWDFAKEHGINIEEVGYDVIPEAVEYFKNLLIPMELLIDVKELDSDGGDEIYAQIIPFWDGEDETFNVQSIDDVQYLPCLKSTNSMSFNKEQITALRSRKINVRQY